jgi:hypothetical protein
MTLKKRIARTLINEIVVDIDAAYRASRLGCQLSGCEIECPTGAGRPVAATRLTETLAAKPS